MKESLHTHDTYYVKHVCVDTYIYTYSHLNQDMGRWDTQYQPIPTNLSSPDFGVLTFTLFHGQHADISILHLAMVPTVGLPTLEIV